MIIGKYFGECSLLLHCPRTCTITCTKDNTVLVCLAKRDFYRFFMAAPAAIAEFELKLAHTQSTLRSILYHAAACDYFEQQLKEEFSIENLTFWKAAVRYRTIDFDTLPPHREAADSPAKSTKIQYFKRREKKSEATKVEEELELNLPELWPWSEAQDEELVYTYTHIHIHIHNKEL